MIETKPRINRMRQPWTAVFELVGSRQQGVATQVEWSTKCILLILGLVSIVSLSC